jgi:hypothetical protein
MDKQPHDAFENLIFPTYSNLKFDEKNLAVFLLELMDKSTKHIVLNKYLIKILCIYILLGSDATNNEFEYIRFGGKWQDFLDNLNTIRKLDHKISFNMLWFLLNYDSVFGYVDYLKGLGFHNNSFVIGALISPDHLNIRHLPENVLNSLKLKLQSKIDENPGYLLEDSYRNMLHYIEQPIEKNLSNSIEKLATMDQRRGVDSSEIFTELYKLKEGK